MANNTNTGYAGEKKEWCERARGVETKTDTNDTNKINVLTGLCGGEKESGVHARERQRQKNRVKQTSRKRIPGQCRTRAQKYRTVKPRY